MPQPKILALLLFGSLGLNLFLGGALGSQWISSKKSQTTHEGTLSSESEIRQTPNQMIRPRMGAHPGARARADGMSASADLALLRQMVGVMGGPNDPRLRQLREKQKGAMSEMRREVHAAHERVRAALSEEANEKELSEALKHLRKTTFEAQARAQEGIVLLSNLMTPEERKRLRGMKPANRPGDMHHRK